MKQKWFILSFMALAISVAPAGRSVAAVAKLAAQEAVAGTPISLTGTIAPGTDLYVVVSSTTQFTPADAPGVKERKRLTKKFSATAIPPIYYVLTTAPHTLAAPIEEAKGQTNGIFAFPPFKYDVRVNKIVSWDYIPAGVRTLLGPITTKEQWEFLTYTHEDKVGINTISKEEAIGGGNTRMILADHPTHPEAWNKGVSLTLDKSTGAFTLSMTPYKNLAPDSRLDIYVNGEKIGPVTITKSGFFFATANTYMNPLLVVLGSFVIGVFFVIMGAAGGLFTAAFQITVIGTKGPVGIDCANTIKPTNLFLTLCSPLTGLISYFKERRFAWPVALFFAAGILIGAFWLGPTYSAKYLPMKAYKFYLGIVCLIIGLKLFSESLPGSIAKKKAMKAVIDKFNAAVREAKRTGTATQMGKVEFAQFNPVQFDIRFWGETFVARPLVMFFGGILMGMIGASFGVGGGFMFMPFMTTLLGYPMYLAVPIALAGTFATSLGGIAKYILMGYEPDWLMAAGIAAGAICGGMVGPRIQKRLPEVLLKRLLALALILVFLSYTDAISCAE